MDKRQDLVNITYSAGKQKELNAIRAKYLPGGSVRSGDLNRIRALDEKAESRAAAAALSAGILSVLVLGTGLSCVLVWDKMALGVITGLIGLAGVTYAWPLYQRILQRERKKAAPEIQRMGGSK